MSFAGRLDIEVIPGGLPSVDETLEHDGPVRLTCFLSMLTWSCRMRLCCGEPWNSPKGAASTALQRISGAPRDLLATRSFTLQQRRAIRIAVGEAVQHGNVHAVRESNLRPAWRFS